MRLEHKNGYNLKEQFWNYFLVGLVGTAPVYRVGGSGSIAGWTNILDVKIIQ